MRDFSQYDQLGNMTNQDKADQITKLASEKKICYNGKFEIYSTIKIGT